ncbi:MAG TPA: DUF4142 domain-containing protein [Bryobacteraceae bacterium]|nr:DUF4142 domain-containing protein [Bryobacteraceae bacterium]
MFSPSLFLTCAAAFVLAGPGWAQMQPGGQSQMPQNPQMGLPQGTLPTTMGNIPPSERADPYMVDKDFVKNVAEASATEVHLGKIAEEKASSDAVKRLGKQMVDTNTQTGQQLQQAATALKVNLPAGPPKKAKKDGDKLAKLSGGDFDQAYTRMAADQQKQTVKEFERESKDGKSPALKDWATKNLPVEQERQQRVDALNTGGTAAAK